MVDMQIKINDKQREAIGHFAKQNFIGIAWWKPGQGKTRIALSAVMSCAPSPRMTYIIAPANAKETWENEIEKVGFWLPYEIHSADSICKIQTSRDFSDAFLIVDELFYFANPNAARTKALKRISSFFPHRLGLSGTIQPAGDNITIWGQFSALNLENFLAKNATEYRSKYQEKVFDFLKIKGQLRRIPKQKNRPNAEQDIIKIMQRFVHVYFPDDSHRQITHAKIDVGLSKQQLEAINRVKTEFQLALGNLGGNVLDYRTAIEVMFTVCKITNGYIAHRGSEILKEYDNPKLTALQSILETLIAAGEKVVIWCNFRNDVFYLEKHLPYRCLRFMGAETFQTQKWESGEYPIVLATCASGASVNYFGQVKYAVYYSLPMKLKDFQQSKGRHERQNSQHLGAYYYHLVGKAPSFDAKILHRLEENADMEKNIIIEFAKNFLK